MASSPAVSAACRLCCGAGPAALVRQQGSRAALLVTSALTQHGAPTADQQQQPLMTAACRTMEASTSSRTFFSMAEAPQSLKFNQRKLVGWTPEQLYTVVSRVEDYHKFVPWCQKSRIVRPCVDDYLEAELEVGFQVLVERYTSQVFLAPTRQVRSKVANSTLFHHLDSTWQMDSGPTAKSCWLSFNVDFAFRSHLHGYLADMFFSEVVKQMTGAFEKRCCTLYGPSSLLRAEQLGHKPAPASGRTV